ncbi:MAG: GGDEF domain-containing protein [Alphaproteobacteria bacterium]|nr:GGDEF domain-containing protein [Alphaproteobacteria bacterium]
MIYGLLGVIAFLIIYVVLLHIKLHEMGELVQESNILTANESARLQNYYLKFNIDKDMKITQVNGDTLSYSGYTRESLIGQNVLGTLLKDVPANKEMLDESFRQLKKKKRIISSEQVLQKADGTKIPVLLRARPILNELLHCRGISFWGYPLKQQLNLEKQLRQEQEKDQLIGEILNAESFCKYLEDKAKICNRYNKPLLLIVVELADIYNFVNKGFSFEKGDKLLRLAADACVESTGKDAVIGRFEHTKIGIILENFADEKIEELTQILWDNLIANVRKLNVDKVNAGMIGIYYTRRKNNDEAENMLSRTRKYLSNSLAIHRYGVGTRDKK